MYTNLRIKIGRFFKKYKKVILIVAIIWLIIITINYYLKHRVVEVTPSVTYEPHVSVMDSTSSVPKKQRSQIEDLIAEFIDYCNNKEYEKGYNLIRQDCQETMFGSIEKFKDYVDYRYENKKLYSIQDYSNYNNMYIYQVKIFDDYLASGLTNQIYQYGEEKFTIVPNGNNLELLVGNFIEKVDIKNIAEDKYLKINVKSKIVKYSSEEYVVKITNKSEYIAVLMNNQSGVTEEILLELENDNREIDNELSEVILLPGQSKEYVFKFEKYYDENDDAKSIVFDTIRILPEYTGYSENVQSELDNAISKYSLKVPLS